MRPYQTEEKFLDHLCRDHNLSDTHRDWTFVRTESAIGMNNLPRFWCGFCRRTISQALPVGIHQDQSRFDHVHEHFKQGKRRDSDWVYYQNGMTRDEIANREDSPQSMNGERPDVHATRNPEILVTSSDERVPRPKKRKSTDQAESMWECVSEPLTSHLPLPRLTLLQCACGFEQLTGLYSTCNAFDSDCNHGRCSNCVTTHKRQKLSSKGSPPSMERSKSAN